MGYKLHMATTKRLYLGIKRMRVGSEGEVEGGDEGGGGGGPGNLYKSHVCIWGCAL